MITAHNPHPKKGVGPSSESRRFSINTQLMRSILTVHIRGELDLATAEQVDDTLEAFDGRANRMLFYLGGLEFVDVVGWRPIRARCVTGAGNVVTASSQVRRIMRLFDICSPQTK